VTVASSTCLLRKIRSEEGCNPLLTKARKYWNLCVKTECWTTRIATVDDEPIFPGDEVRSLIDETLTPDFDVYHDRRGEVVDVLEDDAGRRPGTSVTTFYIGFNSTMARKWTFGGGTFDRSESGGDTPHSERHRPRAVKVESSFSDGLTYVRRDVRGYVRG